MIMPTGMLCTSCSKIRQLMRAAGSQVTSHIIPENQALLLCTAVKTKWYVIHSSINLTLTFFCCSCCLPNCFCHFRNCRCRSLNKLNVTFIKQNQQQEMSNSIIHIHASFISIWIIFKLCNVCSNIPTLTRLLLVSKENCRLLHPDPGL